jgi:hypothetical protein
VNEGENVTCTYTNTLQRASITINKSCGPSSDTGKFDLKLDSVTKTADAACGTGTGAIVTTVGGHTVAEGAGTGTSLSNYTSVISGDCAGDGTITLAAGDAKTCTITNTRQLFTIIVLVCRQADDSLYSSNVTVDGVAKNSLSAVPGGLAGVVTESDLCTKLLGGARYTNEVFGGHTPADISIPSSEAVPTP